MVTTSPPIYFYLPPATWPSVLPEDMNALSAEEWNTILAKDLQRCNSSWILQTYIHLKKLGVPCQLVKVFPEAGIVFAFRGSIPFWFKPSQNLLLICVMADAGPHPYAQLHVVQNPHQTSLIRHSYFIPHWVQPGLISRNPERGNRFETVSYFGCPNNLASELKDQNWSRTLKELGFQWQIVPPSQWHDYSNTDAIVAVRSFEQKEYVGKPATKLFQAWHAGVPAILGAESAYRAEIKSELDYLEVHSPDEILQALNQLRSHQVLRHSIIQNGQKRAEETKPNHLIQRWKIFIDEIAVPAWKNWSQTSLWQQQAFFLKRYLAVKRNGFVQRMSLKHVSSL